MPQSSGEARRGFLIVFAAALAIRIVFVLVWGHLSPEWNRPGFHGAELHSIAVNIYEGRGFSDPYTGTHPSAWFAPFTPLLWAGVLHLMAGPSPEARLVIGILQAIASAVTAGLLWLVAVRIAMRMPVLPPRFPGIFAAVWCIWPGAILPLSGTWYYTWEQLCVTALFFQAMRWIDAPNVRGGILLGAIAGVLALVNATPLLAFPALVAAPLLSAGICRKEFLLAAAASVTVAFCVVAPWFVRNTLTFDGFVPIRGNLGLELQQAFSPGSTPRQTGRSIHPTLDRAERAIFNRVGEYEYSRRALAVALDCIRRDPTHAVVVTLQRFYVYWFSDILDQWPWREGHNWWSGTPRQLLLGASWPLTTLIPTGIVFWGLLRRRLNDLPYQFPFVAVFLFVPVVRYITAVNWAKASEMQSFLLLHAMVALSRGRPRS